MQRGTVMVILCVMLAFMLALVADFSTAQTSRKMMNLQGRLTDTEGSPTTGPHLFELRIFDSGPAGSGNQLYYEAQRVEVNKGIYNILVGDGYNSFTGDDPDSYAEAGGQTGGIPAGVFNRDNLWLEIEIDEDNPLDPRTRVVSSAYSFNSDTLDGKDSGAFLQQGEDGQVATLSFVGGGEIDSSKVAAIDDLLSNPGGFVPLGRADSRSGSTDMDHVFLQVDNLTKQSASSTLRYTYSDTFYREGRNVDCIWYIQHRTAGSGSWQTVCTFEYEGDDESRTTSAGGNTGSWWQYDRDHTHGYSDAWTRRVPITAVCVKTGLAAGNYDHRVDASGGSGCDMDQYGDAVLLVDEAF